jgi:hypothetical protein
MIKKISVIALLALVALLSCSRKGDEALPQRIGDLRVRFQIEDRAGLPATFPVTVNVYSDSARTLLTRTTTVTADTLSYKSVDFTNLAVAFFYVRITVNVEGLSSPYCLDDMTVFVKLHEQTVSPIRLMTVFQGRTTCTDLSAP